RSPRWNGPEPARDRGKRRAWTGRRATGAGGRGGASPSAASPALLPLGLHRRARAFVAGAPFLHRRVRRVGPHEAAAAAGGERAARPEGGVLCRASAQERDRRGAAAARQELGLPVGVHALDRPLRQRPAERQGAPLIDVAL